MATDEHLHHTKHHSLIDERAAAYRSGSSRLDRREAYKKAVWTIADHIRCCHGVRHVGMKSLSELENLHGALHSVSGSQING